VIDGEVKISHDIAINYKTIKHYKSGIDSCAKCHLFFVLTHPLELVLNFLSKQVNV